MSLVGQGREVPQLLGVRQLHLQADSPSAESLCLRSASVVSQRFV